MTYILHIDTSGPVGMTALAGDGNLLAVRYSDTERNHASVINEMIASVLEEGGIGPVDLGAVAVCGGPGSYTGLRIGLATAKGLCFASDKPLIEDNRLWLMAGTAENNHPESELYASVIKARAGEYFIAVYDEQLQTYLEPALYTEEKITELLDSISLKHIVIAGSLPDTQPFRREKANIIFFEYSQTDPALWSKNSFKSWNNKKFVDLAKSEPFYLKQVFIAKPKNINNI